MVCGSFFYSHHLHYCQYEWLDKESLFNMKINNLKLCPCYTDPSDEYYELYHGIIHNYLKSLYQKDFQKKC